MIRGFVLAGLFVLTGAMPALAKGPTGAASTVAVFATDGRVPSQGTGVLIDRERRWLLTSWHVVRDKTQIVVLFPRFTHGKVVTDLAPYQEARRRKEAIPAQMIAVDSTRDLAVLELKTMPSDVFAAVLAESTPKLCEPVTLIGQPIEGNILWDTTRGTALRCGVKSWSYDDGRKVQARVLEVLLSGPLARGYSGGPVFNRKGQLAALVVAAKENGSATIYAVEASELRDLLAVAKLRRDLPVLRFFSGTNRMAHSPGLWPGLLAE